MQVVTRRRPAHASLLAVFAVFAFVAEAPASALFEFGNIRPGFSQDFEPSELITDNQTHLPGKPSSAIELDLGFETSRRRVGKVTATFRNINTINQPVDVSHVGVAALDSEGNSLGSQGRSSFMFGGNTKVRGESSCVDDLDRNCDWKSGAVSSPDGWFFDNQYVAVQGDSVVGAPALVENSYDSAGSARDEGFHSSVRQENPQGDVGGTSVEKLHYILETRRSSWATRPPIRWIKCPANCSSRIRLLVETPT